MKESILAQRRLRRGKVSEQLEFPPGWRITAVRGEPGPAPLDEKDLPPAGSIPVPGGKAVIVVNDAQRPTPTPWLLERLSVDWRREDLVVAVATGSHLPPGEKELKEIFGPYLERVRSRLVLHGASGDDLFQLGRTSRGTPVQVNRCLEGASAVVCLGSVEPHYFAGWTGGRKSVMPGLASLETIRGNHRLALEGGRPGQLGNNAVHLDLVEGVALVREWLQGPLRCDLTSLNVIQHGEHFYGCAYGPLETAVEQLAPLAEKVYGHPLETTFPVVLCLVDHPLDRDLYQALKAFENWKTAVSSGGTLILAAECPEGMGPPTFVQFRGQAPDLEELMCRVSERYCLGDHKLVKFLRYRESGRSALLLSGGPMSGEDLPLPVVGNLEEALERAERSLPGGSRRLLVVEDAGHRFPLRAGQDHS